MAFQQRDCARKQRRIVRGDGASTSVCNYGGSRIWMWVRVNDRLDEWNNDSVAAMGVIARAHVDQRQTGGKSVDCGGVMQCLQHQHSILFTEFRYDHGRGGKICF